MSAAGRPDRAVRAEQRAGDAIKRGSPQQQQDRREQQRQCDDKREHSRRPTEQQQQVSGAPAAAGAAPGPAASAATTTSKLPDITQVKTLQQYAAAAVQLTVAAAPFAVDLSRLKSQIAAASSRLGVPGSSIDTLVQRLEQDGLFETFVGEDRNNKGVRYVRAVHSGWSHAVAEQLVQLSVNDGTIGADQAACDADTGTAATAAADAAGGAPVEGALNDTAAATTAGAAVEAAIAGDGVLRTEAVLITTIKPEAGEPGTGAAAAAAAAAEASTVANGAAAAAASEVMNMLVTAAADAHQEPVTAELPVAETVAPIEALADAAAGGAVPMEAVINAAADAGAAVEACEIPEAALLAAAAADGADVSDGDEGDNVAVSQHHHPHEEVEEEEIPEDVEEEEIPETVPASPLVGPAADAGDAAAAATVAAAAASLVSIAADGMQDGSTADPGQMELEVAAAGGPKVQCPGAQSVLGVAAGDTSTDSQAAMTLTPALAAVEVPAVPTLDLRLFAAAAGAPASHADLLSAAEQAAAATKAAKKVAQAADAAGVACAGLTEAAVGEQPADITPGPDHLADAGDPAAAAATVE